MKQKIQRIILTVIFFLSMPIFFYGQKKPDTIYNCSKIMKELSYYWKLDSLANNGFRLYTYEKLISSRIESITKDFLINELGNPNRVWKQQFGTGIIYVYHIFDISKMPKGYDAPLVCNYIGFLFDAEGKTLLSIKEGEIDM